MKVNWMALATLCLGACASLAHADSLTLVTSQGALAPNDHADFSQLGGQGTAVGTSFNLTTNGGASMSGSLPSTGASICDASYDCNYASPYGYDSIWTNGAGAITFNLPSGVSGFGTTVDSDFGIQNATPYTASLALYNGTTLLGTLTESDDGYGDPLYIGAIDTTGANITSVTLSLSQDTTYVNGFQYNYDPFAGHTDPGYCSSLQPSDFSQIGNVLACPQKASIDGQSWPIVLSGSNLCSYYTCASGLSETATQAYGTTNSPTQDFYADSIDLVRASTPPAVTPEPGSLALLGTGLLGVAGAVRRRLCQ